MEEFPSNLELTAASALLLLSTTVILPKTTTTTATFSKLEEENVVFSEKKLCEKTDELEIINRMENSSNTTSCPSSLTTDCSVSSHRMKLMASAVTRYRQMQLKVIFCKFLSLSLIVSGFASGIDDSEFELGRFLQNVARRARSKVIYRSSNDRKPASKMWEHQPAKTMSTVITKSTTTTECSCLSNGGTSEISSARNGGKAVVVEQKRRRGTNSSHMSRKKEAIMRLLSGCGCASEVRIRFLLGDSPDTSKALRM
ncbi:hypothetical protein BVRB_3g061510 [Beta vulgaris subsp. vulgaris]|nr:hypothetical protein BVRB_3g061510 [Beta vulgaris subsp. vulgaris]